MDPVTPTTDTELDRLNQEYAGAWHVWRSYDNAGRPAAWCATNLRHDDREPTLHATTVAELEKRMRAPGERYAKTLGDLDALRGD